MLEEGMSWMWPKLRPSSGLKVGWRLIYPAFAELCLAVLIIAAGIAEGRDLSSASADPLPGLAYTNCRVADVPWSIHVVQVELTNAQYEIHSVHAGGMALGLDTLSDQVSLLNGGRGTPVAALNGDFYQRDRSY